MTMIPKTIENELLTIGVESLNELFSYNLLADLSMRHPLDELVQDWSLSFGGEPSLCTEPLYTLTCLLKSQQTDIARYQLMFTEDKEVFDEFFNVYFYHANSDTYYNSQYWIEERKSLQAQGCRLVDINVANRLPLCEFFGKGEIDDKYRNVLPKTFRKLLTEKLKNP